MMIVHDFHVYKNGETEELKSLQQKGDHIFPWGSFLQIVLRYVDEGRHRFDRGQHRNLVNRFD